MSIGRGHFNISYNHLTGSWIAIVQTKDTKGTHSWTSCFPLKVLTHAKYLKPNTQLSVSSRISHSQSLLPLLWPSLPGAQQAGLTPELLTKTCCSHEKVQQTTTRSGFKPNPLVQDVIKSVSTLLSKSQWVLQLENPCRRDKLRNQCQ